MNPSTERKCLDKTTKELCLLPDEFVVTCQGISDRFKAYAVLTTDDQIKELLDIYEHCIRKVTAQAYRKCFVELTKYTDDDLEFHYQLCDNVWKNWCNDVVIFYAMRYVLFNTLIPISELAHN